MQEQRKARRESWHDNLATMILGPPAVQRVRKRSTSKVSSYVMRLVMAHVDKYYYDSSMKIDISVNFQRRGPRDGSSCL